MIGKQYIAHKHNVIDLFENYKTKRGNLDDGVDIKFLESRIESLRKGKFALAVAGEVKAGKSTFINALLGEEILPSDVLQASNAIVEIFKSATPFLKVKYADEKDENIDTDEACKRLHQICRILDEYREIPTTLIDEYIIANADTVPVDNDFVKQLEQQSGEDLQNKNSIIEKYISERTKDKIPVKIEFGYPFKWDFDELRIVDSPGVNATGGVQDVSYRFFEKEANAILFVHPIKPIESESFRKFVDSVISNRSKETLFLILTHAGLYSNEEVVRLRNEAGRLYKNVIPENRILVVDSLLKLIHRDLEKGVSVNEIRKTENKKKILSSYKEQAEDEGRELIDVVYESSAFAKMYDVIDEFSMKAPNIQLQEILEKIKAGYEEQEIQYTENADRLEKKKRNPQEYEKEINRIKESLGKYELVINQTDEGLRKEYTGIHAPWQKDIEKLKGECLERITVSDTIESARKNFIDGWDALNEKVNGFSKELTKNLEDTLKDKGEKFIKEHVISIPKVDLAAIEERAKQKANREIDIYKKRGVDIWDILGLGIPIIFRNRNVRIDTEVCPDYQIFLARYQNDLIKKFCQFVNSLPNKSEEVLERYLDFFTDEIKSVITERQKALEEEKKKKQSNEETIEEIQELGRKKKDIQPEKARCIEVLEDLK